MTRACIALVCAFTFAACGAKQFDSLCNTVPAPDGCNKPCDPLPGSPSTCDSGYFCSASGVCDIQCTVGGGQCGDGYRCTDEGRCVDDGGGGSNGPDANCPAVNFTPMPKTPSIQLLLDKSGSMRDPISQGGPSRWEAMKNALIAPGSGVVTALQGKAYIGAMLYAGLGASPCPNLTSVPRAQNNAAAIAAALGPDPAQNAFTPTAQSIDSARQSFVTSPPPAGSPPFIVLATDGLPNLCTMDVDQRAQTVAAARASFDAGVPVYVLAINQTNQHFQDVANAGQGRQSGPNVKYYPVANSAELTAAFDEIIRGVISCDLTLTSAIDPAQASSGTVTINGQQLTFGTDWTLVGGNVIRIQGAACTALKTAANPDVKAQFPCGSVIF
jgi:hypothetical protein